MGGAMVGGIVAIFVLLFIGTFTLLQPKPAADEKLACSSDSDCVPASCCHADSVVNKNFAPRCSGVVCTEECRSNTMDCGQGIPKCLAGRCEVIRIG